MFKYQFPSVYLTVAPIEAFGLVSLFWLGLFKGLAEENGKMIRSLNEVIK